MQWNCSTLHQGGFGLNTQKVFLTKTIVKHWKRLPKEVSKPISVSETFRQCYDLHVLIWSALNCSGSQMWWSVYVPFNWNSLFFSILFSWKIPLHTFLYVHKISVWEHSPTAWSKYTLLQSCSTSRISRWDPAYITLPCSFSLNSAGKAHRFMSCPGAMTCSKLFPGWLPGELGPQEALEHFM